MFYCEFCKISKNIFFTQRLWTTVFESSILKTTCIFITIRFSLKKKVTSLFIFTILYHRIFLYFFCRALPSKFRYFSRLVNRKSCFNERLEVLQKRKLDTIFLFFLILLRTLQTLRDVKKTYKKHVVRLEHLKKLF